MKHFTSLTAIASIALLTSCASIIKGSTDRVEVTTNPATTSGSCELKNGISSWNVAVPGSTQVKKSKTDLEINCKDNLTGATGSRVVESDMEGWFLGNIVFGGIIGGIVDASTGSMWQYPKDVTVSMVGAQPLVINQPAPLAAPAPQPVIAPQTVPAQAPMVFQPAAEQPQLGKPAGTLN